jgi:Chalcone isomerase-like
MRRLLTLLSAPFSIILMAIIIVVLFRFVAHAAELDGLQIPDTLQVDGKILHLNGFGRRSYSIFNIHIYVASLYLEHFNTNPDEIIRSPETKLLTVRFERSITADRARQAWRENFEDNCMAPCHLDPGDVERFLSEVPAMHVGDSFYLLFTLNGATVMVNGQQIGTFSKRQFAEVMLATFIGPNANLSKLRQELLRGHS